MSAYRSAYDHIIAMRLASLRAVTESAEPHMPRLRAIRSARVARAAGGAVSILGAVVLVLIAILDEQGGATYALLASGAIGVGTYVAIRLLLAMTSGAKFWRKTEVPLRLTGRLDVDLARIDSTHPVQAFRCLLKRLEIWSTALPL